MIAPMRIMANKINKGHKVVCETSLDSAVGVGSGTSYGELLVVLLSHDMPFKVAYKVEVACCSNSIP